MINTSLLKKLFLAGAFLSTTALVFTNCKKKNDPVPTSSKTITQIVVDDDNFSTLEAAVLKAKLETTLAGVGPFTVFAPDNTAFAASGITSQVLATLTDIQVKNILLYHTLAANVPAANVPAGPNAKVITASGDSVFLTKNTAGVFVNGIKVKQADIFASNGVIHAIEKVLIPPAGNLVVTAQANPDFSYLVAAILKASTGKTNVAGLLSGSGIYTVFAPTNKAFIGAGFPTIASIQAADPDVLTSILTYHVIAARVFSSDLTNNAQPTTLNGGKVTIKLTSGAQVLGVGNGTNASNITATNIMASNGVIHVIDRVLLP
jgi:uncharacterized surface protein with fasciclin (FAS1) repeats